MESGMFKTRVKRLLAGEPHSGGVIETEEESARLLIDEIAGQLESGKITEVARLYLAFRLRHFLHTGGTLDEAFFLNRKQPRGNPGVGSDTELASAVCSAYLGALTYMSHYADDGTTDDERYRAADVAAYNEWRRLKPVQVRRRSAAKVVADEAEVREAGDESVTADTDGRDSFIRRTILPRLKEWLPEDPRWKGVRRVQQK